MAFTLRFSKTGVTWGSEQRSATPESGFKSPLDWLQRLMGYDSGTGISVNEVTALKLSFVYGAVRNLAEDVAKLPMHLIVEKGNNRTRTYNHPAAYLVNMAPNELMNPFEFKEALVACAALWGNGYAVINRNAFDEPESADIYHPSLVSPQKVNNRMYYVVSGLGTIAADDMIHIKGMSFNGEVGISVIRHAAESMGVSLAAQRFGAKFFSNGANLQGYYSSPQSLSQTAYDRIKKNLVEDKKGVENSHSTPILEEGLTYNKIGIPPEDAQFIETREFGGEDVCRWFRMPPHKLQHLARATHNNVEHMAIEYVTDTLQPWYTKIEQEFNRKLLTTAEQRNSYFKVNVNALLRGDTRARAEMYRAMWGIGALSANDARELEDMNQVAGGDETYVPLNSVPASISKQYHLSRFERRTDEQE